jgi:DNA helicase-2/ATP-dependent DNA helicase PcrA
LGRLSPFADAIEEHLTEVRPSPSLKRNFRTGFGEGFGDDPGRRRPGRKAREESWSDGPSSQEDYNQDLPRFVKGERVSHQTFGSGTVLEVSGFGPDLKVTVNFDSVGKKKLLARYADLEKDYF